MIRNMDTKESILLRLCRGEAGGEKLARELGLTRTAVWKAVCALRADGYDIRSSRKGYKLYGGDVLSAAGVTAHLSTRWTVETHAELSSTSDRAKALAESGADRAAVLAETQTAGRGRLGRSFLSPGGGLYMSALIRPALVAADCGMITAFAAVAAARAVERLSGLPVKIKWVNDLYVGDKKICGILTEGGFGMESGELSYAVVGIGVNLRGSFPGLPRAGSIESAGGNVPSRCELAAAILDGLSETESGVRDRGFIGEYRSRSCVVGRRVTVDGAYEAEAAGIADDCSLLLRRDDGSEVRFSAGEVSLAL